MPRDKNALRAANLRKWMSLRQFGLTVADVTYHTVRRWMFLKMINVVRVGGTNRIYEEEIRRFLQEGTLPPDPERQRIEREWQAVHGLGAQLPKYILDGTPPPHYTKNPRGNPNHPNNINHAINVQQDDNQQPRQPQDDDHDDEA